MDAFERSEHQLFDAVERRIAENARKMMYILNNDWKLLGVDNSIRQRRTENLVDIVQERYEEVIQETKEKVNSITININKTQSEFNRLKAYLNIDVVSQFELEDTLMHKLNVLESDVAKLQNMIELRLDSVNRLNDWQMKLHRLMGCTQRLLTEDPLPSEEAIKNFETYLEELQSDYENRIQIFNERRSKIIRLYDELEETPTDTFHRHIIESTRDEFIANDSNMSKLVIIQDCLVDQLEEKKSRVLEMREKLELLWNRLDESPSLRSAFLSRYPGHSRATEKALSEEIERCEERKRQCFKKFIGKIRTEIEHLWELCYYSELQRDKFFEFKWDEYNDGILERHEEYLKKLKAFYDENKHIFDLYTERQELWKKWTELEEKANEPGRFHNRGGQLLREEKERKTVANRLPKIEKELAKLAAEFESNNNSTFTIYGHDIILLMEQDWDKKSADKQNKLSARKQRTALTPLSVPRSAPQTRRLLTSISKETLTAVKRRLSPRNSPHSLKVPNNIVRQLQFPSTPNPGEINKPGSAKKSKNTPALAVNSYLLKKKNFGRLSQESKKRRRSRKSQSEASTRADLSSSVASYANFVSHINEDVPRSSMMPERNLRSHVETLKFKPDGQFLAHTEVKENISPPDCFRKRKLIKETVATPSDKYKVVRASNDLDVKNNINVFATPLRPVGRSKAMTRQNTVTLASPSPSSKSHPLRRSNSTYNLRTYATSPSCMSQSPKIQFTSKMRLII